MRNTNRMFIIIVTSIFLVVPALSSLARPPEKERQQAMKKIELMKMWKLTEELGLDEEQAVRFFPLHREQEEKRKKKRKEIKELAKELETTLANPEHEDKDLEELFKELHKKDDELLALRWEAVEQYRTVLSTEQIARLILFKAKFMKEFQKMIGKSRMRHGKTGRQPDFSDEPPPPDELPPGFPE